jgi:tRNA-dihydrouridine synthase B
MQSLISLAPKKEFSEQNRFFSLTFGHGQQINFPLIFAPMAGLSHVAMRQLIRSYLPKGARTVLFTEMLSTRLLPKEIVGATPQTRAAPGEDNLIPQLLGNEAQLIARSLENLKAMRPAGIDINMGCPVSKVLKHNWGVALMGDIHYAEQVVRSTRSFTALPLSVKLRTGLKDDLGYLIEFVQMLEEAGTDWVTIHPRFQSQWRRGLANWDYIAKVREKVRIPVVGNGDIQEASDVEGRMQETGCDAIMVARAVTARPWIFWQAGEAWGWPPPAGREGEAAPHTPEEEGREYYRALLFFCDQLECHFAADEQMSRLKLFLAWGHKWLFFGHFLQVQINRCANLPAARQVIHDFFCTPKTMTRRTMIQ